MRQQQVQNRIKNIQIQCIFLVKQLKQYISRRKYRQSIQKVQKIFIKDYTHIHQISAQILINIILLQNKAINKLLSKNIYKKYTYQSYLINKLLKIINRNNYLSKSILVNQIQSKQILDQQNNGLFIYSSNQSINQFKSIINIQQFYKINKLFCQNYITSALYSFINYKTYYLNIQKWNGFNQILNSLANHTPKFSFKIQFSSISIKIFSCKLLFEKGYYTQTLKLINKVIQHLLNLHYNIRIWHQKIQTNNDITYNKKLLYTKKKKYYLKKVSKNLLITLILMIRSNMKLGYENIAIEGIKIFSFVIDKTQELGHFKKYLNPEIYIFQQYCQYRAEKFEIQKIIQPIFLPKIKQLMNNITTQKQINIQNHGKNSIFDFYNEKMIQFQQKLSNKQKKQQIKRTGNSQILQSSLNNFGIAQSNKINMKRMRQTIKSNQSRSKGPTLSSNPSQLSSQNQNFEDTLSSNNILNIQKFIVDELQKSNLAFLTQRQRGSRQFGRIGINIPNRNNTQRQSNTDEVKQSSIVKLNSNMKSLHIAKDLMGKLINNKMKNSKMVSFFGDSNNKKHIIKRVSMSNKNQQNVNSKSQQKTERLTAQKAGQRLKCIQSEISRQLKDNIQILRQKKNSKSNILNKVCKNIIIDDIIQGRKIVQDQISQSFIDEKYAQFIQRTNQYNQNIKQNSLYRQNKKSYRLINNNKNSSTYIGHKYKDKLKHLNKKNKLQLFIQLLIKNKDYLAIKKWTEKIQYLKKKDQMKQKLRSTRKTTSINVNTIPGLTPQMTLIAGNILKYSLQEIEEFGLNSNEGLQKKVKTLQKVVDNENNYRLGQKSIQMLMNKLQKQNELIINNQKQSKKLNSAHTHRVSSVHTNRVSQIQNKNRSKLKHHSSLRKQKRSQWFCKFAL